MKNDLNKGLSLSAYLRTALLNRFKACTGDFHTFDVIARSVSDVAISYTTQRCGKRLLRFARNDGESRCNDERKKDTPRKDGIKSVQYGRSMIEMLGVLAIIGVLSVGGIAGYSKAMRMYNSNLQRQQISELLAAMQQIQPNLNPKENTLTNITSVFDALDMVPQGLTYKNNLLYDAN